MNMKGFLRSIAVVAMMSAGSVSMATHIVGGNLGYTYVGETAPGSQVYRYQVYMQFYLNCGDNSNWPDFFTLLGQDYNTPLQVGCYSQNPQNPDADKALVSIVPVFLTDSMIITPDLPDNCTVGEGLCTEMGLFVGTVDLPLSFSGYHLYFQLCCRNLGIDNIANPNGTGIGYYAFIPPTLVNNSSPVFLGAPTPFLCTGDTTTIVNSASDPDGDQLIFSFETPYNSVSQQGGLQPPPSPLPWTVPEVTWAGGFSTVQPFGAGGYSFINGATGLTEYKPLTQGNYVVAVEVKEYRNSQLIGRTRRDLQLQAIACPANNTPQITGTLPTTYNVNAGDDICFNMSFNDIDADSVALTASGTIFDGNLFNPPATITNPAVGSGSVSAQFCWNTSCDQGQDQPYLFSVSVADNGCPPKNVDVVFQVNVVPFAGPQSITGASQVCTGQNGVAYSTPNIAGAAFTWTVSGGSIASGQGTNAITVNWGASGGGTVQVSATNALGCTAGPASIAVNIAALPVVNAGNDITICSGDTVQIGGSPTGPVGSSFSWTPAASLIGNTTANPNAHPSATTDYIVQVTNTGCVARDTVRVTISVPVVNAGNNVSICAGDTAQLQATGVGSITWSPALGLSATNIADPLAFPSATTLYTATLSDSVACTVQDTVRVTVNQLPQVNAGADTSACLNETFTLGGSPTGPAGSNYQWSPSAGLSNASSANPTTTISGTQTWSVVVTDNHSCLNTDTITVTALSIPSVDAGPDFSVCSGSSVQLQGSGSGTLVWSPAFGLSDVNVPDPICTPEGTITYTLTVTGGNLCTNTDQTTVVVNVLPNANAGPDLQMCLGDSVQLQASGPGTYSWSPANTLSDANATNPMAFPTVTTVYTLTLTDSVTCSSTDQVTVTVNFFNQNLALEPTQQTSGCQGTSQTFSVLPNNAGNTYSWSSTGGVTIDSNSSNTVNITYTTVGAGTISVIVSDDNGCAGPPITLDLTTLERPVADAGPDVTYCIGDSIQLGGSPTGPVGSLFTWSSPSSSINDPSLAAPFVHAHASEEVIVNVTLGQCADQDTVQVNVSVPTANAGADLAICAGDSAQLNASGGVGYAWSPAAGLSATDIPDPLAGPAVTTDYVVVVTNAAQCSTTDTVTVTVNTVANAGVSTNISTCGSGVVFTLLDSLGGTPDPGGVWLDPNLASHNDLFDPAFDAAGTYTYIAGAGTPCPDSAFVQVLITNPNVQISGDNEICTGDTTQLTATGGSTFVWSPSTGVSNTGIANPLFFPTTTQDYAVNVTDGAGCIGVGTVTLTVHELPAVDAGNDAGVCAGNSTVIGGTPTGPNGSSFTWSPGAGLNDVTDANPTAQPSATTTYTVTVVDGNQCTNTDDVVITVNPLPTINAGADTSVCLGSAVQMNATGTGQFAWTPTAGLSDPNVANPVASPTASTTYTVTLTDANSCVNTDEVLVQVTGLPSVNAGEDGYLCPGFGYQLQGAGGGTASWSPSNTLDNANILSPVASPLTTTTYTLTITDGNGCSASDAVQIQVSTDPPIDAGLDQSTCQGGSVTLGGNPTSIPGTLFQWTPTTGLSDATAANPTVTPTGTTLYTLVVTSDTCTSHDQVLITLQGVAQAAFTMRLEPGCDRLRAFFNDLSTGASQWHWDFGDGTTSDEATPQHWFNYGQDIVVTLTVTDVFGCTGTATQNYPVGSFSELVNYEIPNVFTPNGDGKNDLFGVNSDAVLGPCVTMSVFNRWGQKVFESFGNNMLWNGRDFSGMECTVGTYFYTLSLKDMSFNGSVYLNR